MESPEPDMMFIVLQGGGQMKSIIIVTVSLLVIAGCGALEPPVITTKKHTFFSSKQPSIEIDLPQDFEYLGTIDKPYWSEISYVDPAPITSRTERKIYLYGQLTKDNYLQKLITIVVLELPAGKQWADEPIRVNKPLKRTDVKFGGKRFQCCIKPTETTDRYTGEYLLENGITTAKCYMWMQCGRVFGENVKMYTAYYEDVSKFEEVDTDSCLNWFNKATLNDKQKQFLEGFEARAYQNIRILSK